MVELKFDDEKNNLKLPKNIRQVGKPGEKIKIYVEDYVITYINQIARESTDQQRLAVLLGKLGKNKEDTVAFIDGAVEARGVVVQEDQVVFTSEIWTQIYDEIGQYFHNTEVVGWFLTRPGKSLGINDKITKIHVDNFPGVDKALFIIDPVDHDEAFYIYSQGELARQEGYYIYYERNEDMQNYMVDHKSGESTEQQAGNAFLKKKEEILERRQAQKKENGKVALFSRHGASSAKKTGEPSSEKSAKTLQASEAKKTDPASEEDKKSKAFSGDLLKGMKRASSLVVTFAILFALIFGFSQLNRRQTQEVSNPSGNDMVPVDVASGDLTAEDGASGNDAVADVGDAAVDVSVGDAVSGNDGSTEVSAGGNADASSADSTGEGAAGAQTSGSADADSGSTGNMDGTSGSSADAAKTENSSTDNAAETGATGNTDASTGAQTSGGADAASGTSDDATADAGGESEVAVQNVIRQYEVQYGDTLAEISVKFYNDYKYIQLIQEMNQIEDPDKIYPGMMLNLPDK